MTNNSIEKIVCNKNNLPNNTNTNGFAISQLKWGDIVNTSGTTGYSDFKTTKIPVYAGFTYQPEIRIVRPERPITRDLSVTPGVFTMMVIDLNGDGNLTDEFYAGNFWVNTLNTATSPGIASTTTTHYFRNNSSLAGGLTIPSTTTSGEKLMRVIHMFRSPNEFYNINLGPTLDGLTTSRQDFEIEEYIINVLPFTAANASVERIVAPLKPGNRPVIVSAVIRNFSNTTIANFPVTYRINGGIEIIETVTSSIAAGSTATFTFATKADLSLPAEYTIEVYTKLLGDTDATNDSKSTTLSKVGAFATNVTGTFDGVDDYIVTDVTPALSLTNNYTFEAWINQKEPTAFGRIIDKSSILLFVHNKTNLALYKENSLVLSITTATGGYVLNTALNSIQQNKWHHVAFTVSSTNVYTIYIDGAIASTTQVGTVAAGPATANATNPIFIGNNLGLARGFNGNIDEVRIWSGVRNQATIANNTTTKYIGNEAGLLAYYSIAEGNKNFVYDATISDNGAKILNADTNGLGNGKFWNVPVLLQSIQFNNQLSSSYDPITKTYTVLLNDGANVTNAIANFTVGMNSIAKVNNITQVSGVTPNDYTNPVSFVVEGVGFNSGISETYTIKMLTGLSNESKLLTYNFDTTNNPSLAQPINTAIVGSNATANAAFGIDVSNLKANFQVSTGAELFIDDVKQENQVTTPLDYSRNRIITVVSENKISRTNYMIVVDAKNTEANFITYSVANQIGTSLINTAEKTIKVFVNNNANLNALLPTFQVSASATTRIGTYLQNNGITTLNYTQPVVYNIIAQNGNIVYWTVTVERAKPTITLLGDAVVSVPKGCVYTEAGYTAKDNLDNDITSGISVTGLIDINTIGQYTLTYTATDELNNTSTINRIVNVTNDTCNLAVNTNSIDGFSIFPNPVTQGKLFIITASNSQKNIEIYDVLGKQVFSLQTTDKEINTVNLPSGIYVIKVQQDNKTSTQKLIVR